MEYIKEVTYRSRNISNLDEIFPLKQSDYDYFIRNRLNSLSSSFKELESLNLNEKQLHSLINIKSAVEDIKSFYSNINEYNYNRNLVENVEQKIIQNKKDGIKTKSITVTMTTCKRIDLFKKTINSLLECVIDLPEYLYEWIIVDDQSSEQDINEMKTLYPFITIIRKSEEEKGHPRSMNIIKKLIKTPYFLHLEDDFMFFEKKTYIGDSMDIFNENENIKQVMFNLNYAEDCSISTKIKGSTLRYTKGENKAYFIHNYIRPDEVQRLQTNYTNCHYWPHFSFRVGLNKTELFTNIGDFVETPCHFEMEFAYRYMMKGYKTAFLPTISYYHIGRRTYEREDSNKTNAYELNDQSQFGQKSNKKEIEIKKESENKIIKTNENEGDSKVKINKYYNIRAEVINLKRRPNRLISFLENNPININFIHTFDAIDGKTLNPNQKIMKLFEKGDYNYRRGIVGCTLSHLSIWKNFISDINVDYLFVLEDDARLTYDFHIKLLHLLNTYENQFDVLYLGMFPYHHKDKHNFHYTEKTKDVLPTARQYTIKEMFETSMGGNHGYIMTKKGVYNCLEYIRKNGMTNAVDWMVMKVDTNRTFYCEPFLVEAPVFQKDNCQTDIQQEYDIVRYNQGEWLLNEIVYWTNKHKIPVETTIDELNCNDLWDKQISIITYDDFTINKNIISEHPILWYTIEDKNVILVPEYFITKEINEELTFNGYLNPINVI